jgi:hypothetical protein
MRHVLVQLELTSNGRTSTFEAPTAGGYYTDHVPSLGQHDAPHLFYDRLYSAQTTDEGRDAVLGQAEDELEAIRVSRGDPSKEESLEERNARIVEEGEGFALKEVAIRFRCSKRAVREARRDAGRDEEWGRPAVNGHALPDRNEKVREMAADGMPARQIAIALRLSPSTVRRALGRKA